MIFHGFPMIFHVSEFNRMIVWQFSRNGCCPMASRGVNNCRPLLLRHDVLFWFQILLAQLLCLVGGGRWSTRNTCNVANHQVTPGILRSKCGEEINCYPQQHIFKTTLGFCLGTCWWILTALGRRRRFKIKAVSRTQFSLAGPC